MGDCGGIPGDLEWSCGFMGSGGNQSTGKSYLLNTNHDGTYGRMLTVNGMYTINGNSVYLTFDQNHNGTFGAITSGLSEARSSGVKEVSLPSIPTDLAISNTNPQNNSTTSPPESQANTEESGYKSPYDIDWSKITEEELREGAGATGGNHNWH